MEGVERFQVWIAEPGSQQIWAEYITRFKNIIGE